MVQDLLILGSGGLAQEYAWLVEEINEDKRTFNLLGYLDDDLARQGQEYVGYPVLGRLTDIERYPNVHAISGVGDPRLRRAMVEGPCANHRVWANLVSPTCRIHSSHRIGVGVMIGRYADLTVGCVIGNHVMLNIHCVLGHAVSVGDFSVVSPNVTLNGEAVIGRCCYVGANAFVRNVRVGDGATIGASSAVANWIAPLGPHVDAFEREFCERWSGAARRGAVLRHRGAAPGAAAGRRRARATRCWCPTLTFSASVNPIVYLGATPVFIDSERASWNMDPALLEEELERRARAGRLPRAVVVVHLYGQCADLDPIVEACERHGVPLIEDAAEALGAPTAAGPRDLRAGWASSPSTATRSSPPPAAGCWSPTTPRR
jgi:sugar O-acyltransferase (sialic acid O-acetyltransferase NeuD family)